MPPMGVTGRYEEYSTKEIQFIETELKDWFLQRRFAMERNMALKKTLDENNFTGLSMANSTAPDAQKVMWSDLVQGKPELDDTLSANAKQMKADMYTKMFKDSTDLDHPCRIPGATYMRCLSENFKEKSTTRQMKCMPSFDTFDACRKGVMQQQAQALENALIKQDIADRRAKALFERRSILLDTQS
mmetsp:Transcript_21760/g.39004  ORF Transcript_21760/g.39004 Transcript_21760/m.39004 type:complete len:187 (+) Transcript_21760:60-620(+)|eukprot:CAMPEP_0197624622 /NCGR_PEP_ID=MMETSP1338-20131121/4188_1 /TAXON_ID=43686 ORGANISM="Pelagodinium beii, Strain RCC1491" /NCGR_SAMPLE_ID=MMETSP1338 /ASSEMBLY_ACC=CAM_ASM_000754 /LENGTH=186 /DNA_ID=CAMNT_0043194787 /DNA_START=48 /DNA_END=608 /DNA_ORIENTATION=-